MSALPSEKRQAQGSFNSCPGALRAVRWNWSRGAGVRLAGRSIALRGAHLGEVCRKKQTVCQEGKKGKGGRFHLGGGNCFSGAETQGEVG